MKKVNLSKMSFENVDYKLQALDEESLYDINGGEGMHYCHLVWYCSGTQLLCRWERYA